MIGTPMFDVTGIKEDGTEVKIMTKGDFTDDFKTR